MDQGRAGSVISFPRDEGLHGWATDEWWYLSFHLTGEDGTRYGLAVCFFTGQCMSMLVDATRGVVLHSRVDAGQKFEASSARLDIGYGMSTLRQTGGPGSYALHFETSGLVADLAFTSKKEPVQLGGTGLINEGLVGRSYYYAQTRLEAEGSLELAGERSRVRGTGWMDRQWGIWDWGGLGGWEWFSLQLDNGAEVAAIRILHPVVAGVTELAASICKDDGTSEALKELRVRRTAAWRSRATRLEYGTSWELASPGRFELRIEAVLDHQEAVAGLWEGECRVRGSYEGRPVSGMAYVEQSFGRVGGGRARRLAFLLLAKAAQVLLGTTRRDGGRRLRAIQRVGGRAVRATGLSATEELR